MEDIKKNYTEDSIQILEGLEAVRKRPGMYIGSTDARGLHHLVWEIVDNAIDEALSGYGNEINVTIKNDNSIEINDFGRGLPYRLHKSGRPTTEVIFTVLHAGGKFSVEGGYKVSGGLHGVGASVVNALSQFLEVTIYRDGLIHKQRFSEGGKVISPLEEVGKTKRTGTSIWFKPDPKIFSTTLYNYETIRDRIRESAFLIKNIKITLNDERNNMKEVFQYQRGISEYVEFLNKGKTTYHDVKDLEGVYQINKTSAIEVETAFQFTNQYSETLISFVNNVRTRDGGTHETGFKSASTRAINDYARKYGFLKEKDANLDGVDIREGITAVISIRIPEAFLEFEGQTKSKLGSPEARNAMEAIIYEKLTYYLEENAEFSSGVIKRSIDAYKVREAARKARDDARSDKKKNKKEVTLSGKLTPAQGKDKTKNELFLVEGDSAGGSAKQGRDRRFQAILPLRGKVINTEKANVDAILKNEEINTIIHTIGADFGADFDVEKSNYSKVIIMTDADTDGAHIQVLLLTFFFRYMKPLVEAGKLYLACPPLYKITIKKGSKSEVHYAWDDIELKKYTQSSNNFMLQRYKGLGEMNFDQLWETTMDPKTRSLIQVKIDDESEAEKRVSILMGDQVAPRRTWIENNVDFVDEDDYQINKEAMYE
ncbi:MAG: DNA topoisomerase IV subunit B [Paracholeplasma sp.]|uniref:DNA topoisomerase 4 subunit B n=1 Tax=Acholeplasma brassicae TaxID=61635 RepID=U4KNH9_9MOLU|nr:MULTISPECIES: DNA topoisomerase IV subunit B [Paracholeplasma]MDY3196221.1 DNA topoisomerase IV subunit B [Paracholeplasma sp.]CCV65902.1 DNA topoisomerase IV, subunit B [Paracholeplasma brassicae]